MSSVPWGNETERADWYQNEYAEACKELEHYRNLEVEGRLTEQPCKPGDKVWVIENDEDEDNYAGYLFMGMCGDYAIVCSTYTWCEDFNHQLDEMVDETKEDGETHVSIFHKDDIYLTKRDVILELTEREERDDD